MAAVKVSHGASKDMYAAAAKAEVLKEEYEEETAKFEACQVSATCFLCVLLNRLYHTLEKY